MPAKLRNFSPSPLRAVPAACPRKLRQDSSLVPNAVKEILRYVTPVLHMRRVVARDTTLAGVSLKEGDAVVLWYPGANRDPAVFDQPDRFWVDRSTPIPHLAFGIGQHFCIGARLAELQLRIVFEKLVASGSEFELLAPVRRLRSNFINGIKEMRIRLNPPIRFAG